MRSCQFVGLRPAATIRRVPGMLMGLSFIRDAAIHADRINGVNIRVENDMIEMPHHDCQARQHGLVVMFYQRQSKSCSPPVRFHDLMAELMSALDVNPDLVKKYHVTGPRYTSYPPATKFTGTLDWLRLSEKIAVNNRTGRGLSLYFHIPFCETLCWFCGCTTVITTNHGQAGS